MLCEILVKGYRNSFDKINDWLIEIKNNLDKVGLTSPHSVTIPGALDAWKNIHNDSLNSFIYIFC